MEFFWILNSVIYRITTVTRVMEMKTIKIKGRREPITMAEWDDVKDIVKAHLKKYKDFYDELAEL